VNRRLLSASCAVAFIMLISSVDLKAQGSSAEVTQLRNQVRELTALVGDLESRMAALEKKNEGAPASLAAGNADDGARLASAARLLRTDYTTEPAAARTEMQHTVASTSAQVATPVPFALPGGATLNYYFDGYFENNFNNPTGRVNNLRAYDVLSRTFSLNQADMVFALDPDVAAGRRYGVRIDLQYGQATETLQGNPANEPRPEIYRNIFQAYGTYIAPLGNGLEVDFGKWSSSLGIEGNYTKDQMNYSRSYYFNFLPFYHMGMKLHYNFSEKFGVNYWVVNGTNQSEPTNGFKDQMFGFVAAPKKTVSWTFNYYFGQEHPDAVMATNCTVPVQPGLCYQPIANPENGKLHIFDSYVTWNATPKLTLAGEGDYVIQRAYSESAPQHVDGGAGYAQYQFSPRYSISGRMEYLSDRGGMFSNVTQALKEGTATFRYNVNDNMALFTEYRRDWTNVPYFVTNNPLAPATHQDTLGAGVVWWYGGKQGAW
jgi:Putative beta-barrel porin-2, OmpL-like. bbp2